MIRRESPPLDLHLHSVFVRKVTGVERVLVEFCLQSLRNLNIKQNLKTNISILRHMKMSNTVCHHVFPPLMSTPPQPQIEIE